MPAKKPLSMNRMHLTKAQREARKAAESSLRPLAKLTVKPPAWLKGHAEASKAWARLLSLYQETEEEIITGFDGELLATYCLLLEEIFITLPAEKVKLQALAVRTEKSAQSIQDPGLKFKMLDALIGINKQFFACDSRLDRKRRLALDLQSSLYLTPRARAGAKPTQKESPAPLSEMEKLLNEDTND